MSRFFKYRLTAVALVALSAIAVVAIACGGADSSSDLKTNGVSESSDGGYATGSGADFAGSPGSSGGASATPAPSRPAPQPTVIAAFPTATPSASYGIPQSDTDSPSGSSASLDEELAQFAQNRIIVRNVNISIETRNIASTIEQIGDIATQTGGWVVSTQQIEVHRGEIDIRVPADRLDATLRDLRALADNIVSEVSTSQDFT